MKLILMLIPGLLLASAGAIAQSADLPTLDDPYYAAALPRSGAYYDPTQPGTGMFVDVRPDGSAFIHLGVYDARGRPTWYAIQDRFEPTYAYVRNALGGTDFNRPYRPATIGAVHAPVYRAEGGQCLGCAYTVPRIEEATELGQATIEWSDTGNVRVSLLDHVTNMQRLPLDGSDAEKFVGRWAMQGWVGGATPASQYPDASGRFIDSVVDIQESDALTQLVVHTPDGNGQFIKRAVTHRFTVNCVSGCEGDFWHALEPGGATSVCNAIRPFVWFEESTGAAGIEQYCETNTGELLLSPFRYAFSLHLSGDGLWGRRAHASSNSAGIAVAKAIEGSLLRMDRLP